jgi:hypothetical protein
MAMTIAIFHEHPDWFRPLFAELERRGHPVRAPRRGGPPVRPVGDRRPWSLVFNRASPSAYLRDARQTTFHTLHWLRHLERLGVPVVNGSAAYGMELSKATQCDLMTELGVPFPKTRVINHPSQAVAAARGLRYPVLVKANVGGSGAGIVGFHSEAELAAAAEAGQLDLGVDGTALVQEQAPLRDGRITRVETLGGEFLYAIHVYPADTGFNLCPADACQTGDGRGAVAQRLRARRAPRTACGRARRPAARDHRGHRAHLARDQPRRRRHRVPGRRPRRAVVRVRHQRAVELRRRRGERGRLRSVAEARRLPRAAAFGVAAER